MNIFIITYLFYAFLLQIIQSTTKPLAFSTFSEPAFGWGSHSLFNAIPMSNVNYTSTIAFSKTYYSTPFVIISVSKIKTSSDISKCDFKIQTTFINQTRLILSYSIGSSMVVTSLAIRYLAYEHYPSFKALSGFYLNSPALQNSSFSSVSQLVSISSWFGSPYLTGMTTPLHHNRLYTFLRGLKLNSTGGNLKYMQLIKTVYNDTFWNITIIKPDKIQIFSVEFDLIHMSTNHIDYSTKTIQWGGTINSTRSGFTLTNSSVISQPMMLAGLAFFQAFNDSSALDYDLTLSSTATSTTITINNLSPAITSKIAVNTVTTDYLFLVIFYCPAGFLNLHISDLVCEDICPANTVYIRAMSCAPCAYQCATCSVPKVYERGPYCLTCPTGRILSSGNCICANNSLIDDGYSSTCRSCSSIFTNTLTCQFYLDPNKTETDFKTLFSGNVSQNILPYFTALSCVENYYVSGKSCKTCQQIFNYCLSCTNSSQCATCNSSQGALKYTDGKCYLCNVSFCTSCSQNNYCATCQTGYMAINGSCQVQPCNQSCSCEGWAQPKINGKCSTQCGDSIVVGDEQCDDGNTKNHDGCSSFCKIQTCQQNCTCGGYTLPVINDQCSTICGDGIKVGIQQCDDGNTANYDGCSSFCFLQNCQIDCNCGGWVLPKVNGKCSTSCGDGIKKGSQQCDDANKANHDGCSSICLVQTCSQNCSCGGYKMPVVDGLCSTTCGDNLMVGSEQCDDGNTVDYDGCSSACKIQGCNQTCNCSGWDLPRVNGLCSPICGDGIKVTLQQCDDNNNFNHDGCSSLCKIQTCQQNCSCGGYNFPIINDQCSTVCGDGIKAGTEECDDGNINQNDGCSSNCQDQHCDINCDCGGWVLPLVNGVCSTLCGDEFRRGQQQCDDGNTVDYDNCSSSCLLQPCNVTCSCEGWVQPKINGMCSTFCGDNIKQGDEQCDDGNQIQTDGCSLNCKIQKIKNDTVSDIDSMHHQKRLGILTTQRTQTVSLIFFIMGFRIVGMQSLWIFQSYQLLLFVQQSPYQISDYIHGYTDPQDFPLYIKSQSKHLFDKFNFMFFAILIIFSAAILAEVLGHIWQFKQQKSNASEQSLSPMASSQGPKIKSKRKRYIFQQNDENSEDNGSQDFTVHYEKKSAKITKNNDFLSQTNELSQYFSGKQPKLKEQLPLMIKISRILMRQVLFNLLLNIQAVLISTMTSILINEGIQNILNFPTLVTIGSVEVLTVSLLGYLSGKRQNDRQNKNKDDYQYWGQNKSLFRQKSQIFYWWLVFSERILISLLIGVKFMGYLYAIVGIKLIVIITFGIKQFYQSKIHYYRCIVTNVLHVLLLAAFTIDTVIIKVSDQIENKLPPNLSLIIYTIILSITFAFTVVFFIKQVWQKCVSSKRNEIANEITNQIQPQLIDRKFFSKKQIEQNGTLKFKNYINHPEQTTHEFIKSVKLNKKDKSLINTKKSIYFQQQYQLSQLQKNSQNKQSYNEKTPRPTFLQYLPNEQEFDTEQIQVHDPRLFRSTIFNSRTQKIMQSTKSINLRSRQVKTARRYARQDKNQQKQRDYKLDDKSKKENEGSQNHNDSFDFQSEIQNNIFSNIKNQAPISSKKKKTIRNQKFKTIKNEKRVIQNIND